MSYAKMWANDLTLKHISVHLSFIRRIMYVKMVYGVIIACWGQSLVHHYINAP